MRSSPRRGDRKAVGGCASALVRRSAPRGAEVRCGARVSVAPQTRCTHCVRCARTDRGESVTKRAGTRADLSPALLAAAHAPPARTRPPLCAAAAVLGLEKGQARASSPVAPARAPRRAAGPAGLDARLASSLHPRTAVPAKRRAGRRRGEWRRREGEPGHKQSSGLFVPGEQLGACARRGLQGRAEVGARTRALRDLTHRDLFERNERSERSEFRGAT